MLRSIALALPCLLATQSPHLIAGDVPLWPSRMPVSFRIPTPFPSAFLAESVPRGGEDETREVPVLLAQVLTDPSAEFLTIAGHLSSAFFHHIPDLPTRQEIESIVLLVKANGDARAWINELDFTASVVLHEGRSAEDGGAIPFDAIRSVNQVAIDAKQSDDEAIVVFRRIGWRRSVYFNFANLHAGHSASNVDIGSGLAVQLMHLLGLLAPDERVNPSSEIDEWIQRLRTLLSDDDASESDLQELIRGQAWLFAPRHSQIRRHPALDDKNIPDFILTRSTEGLMDFVEIKKPSTTLFRASGHFNAAFHEAWDQATRYLEFADKNTDYLRREKAIHVDSPKCYLIIGHELDAERRAAIRVKEKHTPRIEVITYDELLDRAQGLLRLRHSASVVRLSN
ncbi:MAG: Shedu immune nuclease family protein [Planctomycetota bacterium]